MKWQHQYNGDESHDHKQELNSPLGNFKNLNKPKRVKIRLVANMKRASHIQATKKHKGLEYVTVTFSLLSYIQNKFETIQRKNENTSPLLKSNIIGYENKLCNFFIVLASKSNAERRNWPESFNT